MPKVPERPLSHGEHLDKLRQMHKHRKHSLGSQQFATVDISEARKNSRNGGIRTTVLPHSMKCSKCDYIARHNIDLRDHWQLEH